MVFGASSSSSKGMTSIDKRNDGNNNFVAERNLSALIVDDDLIVRRIHTTLLTKLGVKTQGVENGKKAVDLFQSGDFFDLVIMDMEMPVMDGPEATKQLRAMGIGSMIVGVTSRNLESEKQAFMGAGLNDCYVKPLTVDDMIAILNKLNNN
ncbi:hypothetical protein L1049_021380 [Liquidambar formosana]|uniref:Response regulatory domain-containing protein n=1 Tax=Liquidambar formosana TaxID=63359 RepID=A0AAP0N5N6_LIQFO